MCWRQYEIALVFASSTPISKKLLKLLNQLKKDRIIFVVTHKVSILDYFDIILRKENEKFSVNKN